MSIWLQSFEFFCFILTLLYIHVCCVIGVYDMSIQATHEHECIYSGNRNTYMGDFLTSLHLIPLEQVLSLNCTSTIYPTLSGSWTTESAYPCPAPLHGAADSNSGLYSCSGSNLTHWVISYPQTSNFRFLFSLWLYRGLHFWLIGLRLFLHYCIVLKHSESSLFCHGGNTIQAEVYI